MVSGLFHTLLGLFRKTFGAQNNHVGGLRETGGDQCKTVGRLRKAGGGHPATVFPLRKPDGGHRKTVGGLRKVIGDQNKTVGPIHKTRGHLRSPIYTENPTRRPLIETMRIRFRDIGDASSTAGPQTGPAPTPVRRNSPKTLHRPPQSGLGRRHVLLETPQRALKATPDLCARNSQSPQNNRIRRIQSSAFPRVHYELRSSDSASRVTDCILARHPVLGRLHLHAASPSISRQPWRSVCIVAGRWVHYSCDSSLQPTHIFLRVADPQRRHLVTLWLGIRHRLCDSVFRHARATRPIRSYTNFLVSEEGVVRIFLLSANRSVSR